MKSIPFYAVSSIVYNKTSEKADENERVVVVDDG